MRSGEFEATALLEAGDPETVRILCGKCIENGRVVIYCNGDRLVTAGGLL